MISSANPIPNPFAETTQSLEHSREKFSEQISQNLKRSREEFSNKISQYVTALPSGYAIRELSDVLAMLQTYPIKDKLMYAAEKLINALKTYILASEKNKEQYLSPLLESLRLYRSLDEVHADTFYSKIRTYLITRIFQEAYTKLNATILNEESKKPDYRNEFLLSRAKMASEILADISIEQDAISLDKIIDTVNILKQTMKDPSCGQACLDQAEQFPKHKLIGNKLKFFGGLALACFALVTAPFSVGLSPLIGKIGVFLTEAALCGMAFGGGRQMAKSIRETEPCTDAQDRIHKNLHKLGLFCVKTLHKQHLQEQMHHFKDKVKDVKDTVMSFRPGHAR